MDSKILGLFSVMILLVACAPDITPPDTNMQTPEGINKFSSASELRDYLEKSQDMGGNNMYYGGGFAATRAIGVMEEAAAPNAMDSVQSVKSSDGGAREYSSTNIQVQGVDEADILKNDDKYIYTISGNELVIVEAYPAEDADELSETEFEGTPLQLFVNGDRLVVFTQDHEEIFGIAPYDFVPRPRYTQVTHAIVYDISDREDPEQLYDYSVKGNYFQSRMIGDWVYFVAQEGVYYNNLYVDMPIIKEGSSTLIKPEVYYFDNPEFNYNFNTVVALDVTDDEDSVQAKSFMLGYANNLYVSEDNIYITYQKNPPWRWYETQNEDRFFEVVVPILPSFARREVRGLQEDEEMSDGERWAKIQEVMESMYNSMDEDDQEDLVEEIQKAIETYELKQEAERRMTVIQKLNIDEGDINYDTSGEVPGYLLNQFSMDESGEYFRVATNVQLWTRFGSESFNNVYVLDEDLDIVGKLEGLAEGESIYSTRFLGDRLYMVTFKRIDPLFVIDLSEPTNPEVLGELKIPGYSDYLHPYDEDHLIGIGKETESNEWGGVSTGGVKLALFDVSDVDDPVLIDKLEIGDAGSDSEVLRDHKALLFDKQKNILVIPIREVKGKRYFDEYWRRDVWQGAYVFSIDPDEGFKISGKVSHFEGDERENYYYYTSPYDVRRALYMDDVLYTVSSKLIKMNELDDIDEEINELELPGETVEYKYPTPRPIMGTVEAAVKE